MTARLFMVKLRPYLGRLGSRVLVKQPEGGKVLMTDEFSVSLDFASMNGKVSFPMDQKRFDLFEKLYTITPHIS